MTISSPYSSVLRDNAPSVLGNFGVDQIPKVALEPFVRPLLIGTHEARIPRNVGGEDRGEAADRWHGAPNGQGALLSLP